MCMYIYIYMYVHIIDIDIYPIISPFYAQSIPMLHPAVRWSINRLDFLLRPGVIDPLLQGLTSSWKMAMDIMDYGPVPMGFIWIYGNSMGFRGINTGFIWIYGNSMGFRGINMGFIWNYGYSMGFHGIEITNNEI